MEGKKKEEVVFELPEMLLLERSERVEQYGPENPYHCTFKSCCYDGK